VKKVATIASFLERTGELYAPQYGIISQYAINYLMAILEEHYPQHLERFETTSDAIHWLDEHRFSMAQFAPTGNRRISRELARESESREEFGRQDYGLKPMLKSAMVSQEVGKPVKDLPLHEREAAAKMIYAVQGFIPEGFEYLFDSSIQNPHLSPEQLANMVQAKAGVALIIDELLEKQEASHNISEEQRLINLKESAITLMLKNATSSQQMPIPEILQPFMADPSVIQEVGIRIQPYLEQREREMIAREEEKRLIAEEKARRAIV
jgi:hypothetical protein